MTTAQRPITGRQRQLTTVMSATGLIARISAARAAAIERMAESAFRWRQLGSLLVVGGALVLLALGLPHDARACGWGVAACGAAAVALGALAIGLAGRLPASDAALSATLALATALITLAIVADGHTSSPFALLYVWVCFEAFCLFRGWTAVAHLALASAAYALALALTAADGDPVVARWVTATVVVSVVVALADTLRERRDRLIERLAAAARTDALTGLLNRRGFEQAMALELERAGRHADDVSVVIGDIDHFKVVNDRYGHERGDDALRAFGELLAAGIRAIDAVARIGGEEFALVLPGTGPEGAREIVERLRLRTRETLTAYGTGGLSVSFGIASYPEHGDTADELVRHADQALYLAKRLGRGRTVVHGTRAPEGLERGLPEQLPAVLVLAEALDQRSTGTALHSRTVGLYSEWIARGLHLDPERVERVRLAGLLHDIGKLGVPDTVLDKQGPLTDEEWAEMRRHPELGARIVAGANLDDVAEWVLAHHERVDGLGYPAGLAGDEIPLEARILAVADAFEAMTSDRSYRRGMSQDDAVDELRRHAGTQFDAHVVDAFLAVFEPGERLLGPSGREARP
ncbi:MAG TPA: diguanylate cyclase [Solirubrobacteraceae bacterium]|nr:diguanylate cyclase [Solirubrobacteraceae bacterium]